MCGLPLAPLPWLSMWEMSLEEREEKETWERTRWTWENASCGKIGERTTIGDDCKDSFLVNAYSIVDIPVHVADKHRQVPIIVETSVSEANDEEMDDYYENHKAWPTSSS
jgi:hypothetical protein